MRICIISAHFPSYELPNATKYATGFIFQYAEEWVNQGHEVIVIDLLRCYPKLFRRIANTTYKFGYKNLKKYLLPIEAEEEKQYFHHGVEIQRILYKKYIPHSITPSIQIERIWEKIEPVIQERKFDLIIGDCFDPTLQLAKRIYNNCACPFYQVIHNSDFSLLTNKKIQENIKTVDRWLLRSNAQKKIFDRFMNTRYEYEYMYSGIEDKQISEEVQCRNKITKLVYVGTLIKSKGLETILRALSTCQNNDLHLTVVGSGVDEDYFKKLLDDLDLKRRVKFLGQKTHDEVLDIMRQNDALVLISHETFGMVYVEAMSQACIPIGTIDEGIDGIVIDHKNGFLVPLGDFKSLAKLFDSFKEINEERIKEISKSALMTAYSLKISNLAKGMLDEVESR